MKSKIIPIISTILIISLAVLAFQKHQKNALLMAEINENASQIEILENRAALLADQAMLEAAKATKSEAEKIILQEQLKECK